MFRFMVILVMVVNAALFAQAPDTLWTKTFDRGEYDESNFVQQTSDSGYIIVGTTGSSYDDPGKDIWLIKANSNGDSMWAKTYGGDSVDTGISVQQTTDGGYIIAGNTSSFGIDKNLWLIKTDAIGDSSWSKIVSGRKINKNFTIKQTPDDGYIILLIAPPWATRPSKLIKTDAYGDTLWTKTLERENGPVGNLFIDLHSIKSLIQSKDSGYIILTNEGCGQTCANNSDVLYKTNANGDILTYTDSGYFVEWNYMLQSSNDDLVLSGSFDNDSIGPSNEGYNKDVLLLKMQSDMTSINDKPDVLHEYKLQQNYPNPFNPSTTIEFTLPQSDFVTLKVYNILGEEVAMLISEEMTAGNYKYDWNAGKLASGMYLYKIQAGNYVDSKKMILLR